MRSTSLAIALTTALTPLAGCVEEMAPDAPVSTNCAITQVSDAQVWINGMPGGSGPTMIATFTAAMPTPGWNVGGRVTAILESAPPQYTIDLTTTPPDGIVAQVITETEVRLDIPVQETEAAGVTFTCGGEVVFSVDKVETAY